MKKLLAFLLLLPSLAFGQTATTLYTVPTIAALKALTTRPSVIQTTDANPGIFNWSTTPCSAADDIFQVTPTAGPTGCYTRASTPYTVGKSATTNGVLVTNGSGVSSVSTTLPNGLPMNTPTAPFKTPEQQNIAAGTGGDDTATFAAIFAAGFNVKTTPGKTYRLNGLTLNGNTIDCGGLGGTQGGVAGSSKIITGNAINPAGPAIIMKGWGSQLKNCGLGDPNNYSRVQTALSAAAAGGATSIVVSSAANFAVGRLAFVMLDNGVIWPVKIASVVGSTLNFTSGDTLPSAASTGQFVWTATAVVQVDSSKGASFPNGTTFTQIKNNVFNAQPMAIELINSDPNPLANSAFNQQGIITDNYTYYTSLLPLWLDANVPTYQLMNLQLWGNPQATTTSSGASTAGATSINLASASGVGGTIYITLDSGRVWPVNGSIAGTTFTFSGGVTLPSNAASGNTVYTAIGAAASYLQDGRGSVVTYGGHTGVNLLGIQATNGFIYKGANLSIFTGLVSDTPNGILVDQASQWLQFSNTFTTSQSGTSGSPTPLGGYGLKITGNSPQIMIDGLQSFSGGTASSLWIDSGSTVYFDPTTWSGNRTFGGTGANPLMTAGSISYAGANGLLAQDNAHLFWDATNHFLGLNKNNPGSLLNLRALAANTFPLVVDNHLSTVTGFYVQETAGGDFNLLMNDNTNSNKVTISTNGQTSFNGGGFTIGGALTYGGIALGNSFTGSAGSSMVGSISPTFTGTVTTAALTTSGIITAGAQLLTKAYTVATLPAAPGTGARAHVTDATACTFLGALTGGGAVFCPVVYDGTAWKGG